MSRRFSPPWCRVWRVRAALAPSAVEKGTGVIPAASSWPVSTKLLSRVQCRAVYVSHYRILACSTTPVMIPRSSLAGLGAPTLLTSCLPLHQIAAKRLMVLAMWEKHLTLLHKVYLIPLTLLDDYPDVTALLHRSRARKCEPALELISKCLAPSLAYAPPALLLQNRRHNARDGHIKVKAILVTESTKVTGEHVNVNEEIGTHIKTELLTARGGRKTGLGPRGEAHLSRKGQWPYFTVSPKQKRDKLVFSFKTYVRQRSLVVRLEKENIIEYQQA
ncbi:hypothetical protein J6590_025917 [Homalodisca vitripennis]|nr:hypothetical protein J6590_025917 [Homalodisca vitripennis]